MKQAFHAFTAFFTPMPRRDYERMPLHEVSIIPARELKATTAAQALREARALGYVCPVVGMAEVRQ